MLAAVTGVLGLRWSAQLSAAGALDASVAGAAVVILAWIVLPYLVAARRFRWEKR